MRRIYASRFGILYLLMIDLDRAQARGGIGRRSGLKIRRVNPHPGSSPGGPIACDSLQRLFVALLVFRWSDEKFR